MKEEKEDEQLLVDNFMNDLQLDVVCLLSPTHANNCLQVYKNISLSSVTLSVVFLSFSKLEVLQKCPEKLFLLFFVCCWSKMFKMLKMLPVNCQKQALDYTKEILTNVSYNNNTISQKFTPKTCRKYQMIKLQLLVQLPMHFRLILHQKFVKHFRIFSKLTSETQKLKLLRKVLSGIAKIWHFWCSVTIKSRKSQKICFLRTKIWRCYWWRTFLSTQCLETSWKVNKNHSKFST